MAACLRTSYTGRLDPRCIHGIGKLQRVVVLGRAVWKGNAWVGIERERWRRVREHGIRANTGYTRLANAGVGTDGAVDKGVGGEGGRVKSGLWPHSTYASGLSRPRTYGVPCCGGQRWASELGGRGGRER
ncbi:hypothetical protein FRC09_017511, partial [Ceratobasidium sp. 395]